MITLSTLVLVSASFLAGAVIGIFALIVYTALNFDIYRRY